MNSPCWRGQRTKNRTAVDALSVIHTANPARCPTKNAVYKKKRLAIKQSLAF